MLAQLGNHIFKGLIAPSSWGESYGKKFAQIPLVNKKDILQPTGDEPDTLELSFRYSIEFCEPSDEIFALRESMKSAEALPFTTGEGDVIGLYVITEISVTNENYSPTGRLQAASVSLSLLEYANFPKPVKLPEAVVSAKPIAKPPVPPIPSEASSIAQDVQKGKSSVDAMKATLKQVKQGVKTFKRAVREVRQLAEATKQAYNTAKTKLVVAQKIAKRATQLPTSLDEAISYAENLAKTDTLLDTTVLEMNITEMSNRADKVQSRAAPVAAFSAAKETN
jgi:phage protein U